MLVGLANCKQVHHQIPGLNNLILRVCQALLEGRKVQGNASASHEFF